MELSYRFGEPGGIIRLKDPGNTKIRDLRLGDAELKAPLPDELCGPVDEWDIVEYEQAMTPSGDRVHVGLIESEAWRAYRQALAREKHCKFSFSITVKVLADFNLALK